MKKTAIFWGNYNLNYKTDPIICNEEQENQILENLLIDTIGKTKNMKEKGIVPLIPGVFILIKGEENQLKDLKIKDLCRDYKIERDLKEYLVPTFLFLSTSYDPDTHDFPNNKDHLLSLGIAFWLFEGKKERLSLRIDKGLIEMLKSLGKRRTGEYLNLKLANFVLKKYFKIGKLTERINGSFSVCLDAPTLMMASEVGFSCIITEDLKTPEYKESKEIRLVDYALNRAIMEILRDISNRETRTMTSLIKEAIIPQDGRWQEIELQSYREE